MFPVLGRNLMWKTISSQENDLWLRLAGILLSLSAGPFVLFGWIIEFPGLITGWNADADARDFTALPQVEWTPARGVRFTRLRRLSPQALRGHDDRSRREAGARRSERFHEDLVDHIALLLCFHTICRHLPIVYQIHSARPDNVHIGTLIWLI